MCENILKKELMMREDSKSEQLAAALIIGGIIGAGIALLFAPQSGLRTRRQIRHAGEKLMNRVEAAKLDMRHMLANLSEDLAERLEQDIERGREWSEAQVERLRSAMESGRNVIRSEIEKLRDA